MRNTLSSPSLPGQLWPRVEAPDRVLSLGQIELNCITGYGTVFACLIGLFEIEQFLTWKLYLGETEMFEIELF